MNQENLYGLRQIIWFPEESCYGIIRNIRRSIGCALIRYDIEMDDGETLDYVEEDRLYPGRLLSIPEEE